MITPDYIKGYVAALRTIQNGTEAMIESYQQDSEPYMTVSPQTNIDTLNDMLEFIKDQRVHYKELVEKLNAQNKI